MTSLQAKVAKFDEAPEPCCHLALLADLERGDAGLCLDEVAARLGLGGMSAADRSHIRAIAEELFLRPTRFSRDISDELGLKREELVRLYRIIRNTPRLQDLFTFNSPQRRRISFLRRELLPDNLATLMSMFKGEACFPNHVEFHPALVCNLRCRACPNVQTDANGDLHFLGYRKAGEPLDAERLRMIQEMFLELGVESFSFGGGGEPSLSELTLDGISYLRSRSERADIFLYSNGIFPEKWGEPEFERLVTSLNKLRFSIDASTAEEWSAYKGRAPEFFEKLWSNIGRVVEVRNRTGGGARLGASCLVSSITFRTVEGFLQRAKETGLDFCDIKEVETCFGEKSQFKAKSAEFRAFFDELMEKVRSGFFAPMDVVVDDSLLVPPSKQCEERYPANCWVAIRGRMLTVGPYGELYPCSDAANPGSQERRALKDSIGQLTEFEAPGKLREQFTTRWTESLPWRTSLSRANCAYCVPSHTNYNLAVEKLHEDWKFGIMPEEQPLAGVQDHYLTSRVAKRNEG